MNTLLRIAKRDVDKLKAHAHDNTETTLHLVLDFSRSKTDSENLVGYSAFKEELDKLPPTPHPTENIYRACKKSGLNYSSVIFEDITGTISIPIRCKTELARIFIANQNQRGDF